MRLWRLTRAAHAGLDGEGARQFGGRYSPPGIPVVSLASEPGLAVLVAMRYLPARREDWPTDFILGWTDVDAVPVVPINETSEEVIRSSVNVWLTERRSLLMAITSKVLPEARVILMNPSHAEFTSVHPLRTRPFSFHQCLHTPPMLDRFSDK